ncbi:hypothetical protein RI367_006802 [Sorochytrium milnesiophthora]
MATAQHTPTAAIVAVTAMVAWSWLAYAQRSNASPLPRPPGPEDDQLWRLRKQTIGREQYLFYRDLVDTYGDLVYCRLGADRLYIVADAALCKQILADNQLFERQTPAVNGAKDIGPMLFLLSGPQWKLHRTISSPAFAPVHIRNAFDVVQDVTRTLFARFDESFAPGAASSAAVNVHELLTAATLDVFGGAFFSYRFDALTSPTTRMQDASELIARGLAVRSLLPRLVHPALFWDGYLPAVDYVRQLIASTIDAKIKKLGVAHAELASMEKRNRDLLDNLILATQKSDNALSAEDMSSALIGFFLAGHETTSNALTFVFRNLCDNPELVQEMRDELHSVTNDKGLTFDMLPSLKKLDAFIKETLRLNPILPRLGRRATADVKFRDYTVPQGSLVYISVERLHRNPHHWKDPDVFRPSRFETDTIAPGSFLPFGDGAHKCIGEKLALLELRYVTAQTILHYDLVLADNQALNIVNTITLGYKDGLLVHFRKL